MLLGLDIGTGSVKALLLDEDGRTVAEAGAPCKVESPLPGRGETDPGLWWEAIAGSVGRLPGAARAAVSAIGLSGQMHGLVLARDDGTPLRPAILWMDSRATAEAARYPQQAAQRLGNAISAGMAGPMLLWLMQHEPGRVAAARWVLQPKDWLRLKLTGLAASDPSDASATLLADTSGRWDTGLLAELGVAPERLPGVTGSAEVAGQLGAVAAGVLGLRPGIPVAGGAGDTAAAAFGSGLYLDGAAQLTTGSGAQIVVMQGRRPAFSPRLNTYRSAAAPGLPGWYVMAAMQNCGVALEWVRTTLGLSWDEAYALAFQAGEDRGGAMFLPLLTGERTPWMNQGVRGAWVGLSPGDDKGSLMRAAFLGVAFSIRAGLQALRDHGVPVPRLQLAGGGSVHPAWQRLLMDVLQTPLDAVSCPNASARGAALLAGVATGRWRVDELSAMAPARVPLGEPGPARFDPDYARFIDLYTRLSDW